MRTLEYAQPTEQMKLTGVMDLDNAAPIEISSLLTRELSLVIQDRAELASRFLLEIILGWFASCAGPLFCWFAHSIASSTSPTIEGLIQCDISTKGELSLDHRDRVQRAKGESSAHPVERDHP